MKQLPPELESKLDKEIQLIRQFYFMRKKEDVVNGERSTGSISE